MMSRDEKIKAQEDVLTTLREVARFSVQDFKNKYTPQTVGEERELMLILWAAMEQLRAEGIDYGPLKKWPGVYERKDWRQTEQRAQRQRAKGTRAHKRAEQKLRIAASTAPDASKERINDAADRIAVRLAMSRKRKLPGE